ncbi:MAG: hypothetical protein ABI977_25465 [Acidobacteriota bacterium]
MFHPKTFTLQYLLLIATLCAALSGCHRPGQQQLDALAPPPIPPGAQPDLRPPEPAEVREAINRIYGQVVTIESECDQYFIAGDLNGDGAPDLAVVVKPAADKLAEINHELANWIRCNPRKVEMPGPNVHLRRLSATVEPVVIAQNDILLAVIHGYGPAGWRHSQARQSYLLKDAVGSGLKLQTLNEAIKMAKSSRPAQLLGDVVRQTLANEQGMLFYTGAHYAWHRIEPSGADLSGTRQKSQRKG